MEQFLASSKQGRPLALRDGWGNERSQVEAWHTPVPGWNHTLACHLQWTSKLLFQQCHTPDVTHTLSFFFPPSSQVDMWPCQPENIFKTSSQSSTSAFLPLWGFSCSFLLLFFPRIFSTCSLWLCQVYSLTVARCTGTLTNVTPRRKPVCLMSPLNRSDGCFV